MALKISKLNGAIDGGGKVANDELPSFVSRIHLSRGFSEFGIRIGRKYDIHRLSADPTCAWERANVEG